MMMMQNNGHPAVHSGSSAAAAAAGYNQHPGSIPPPGVPPPPGAHPPPHLDPRYMDYAAMAHHSAAAMANPDPLHYLHHHHQNPHHMAHMAQVTAAAVSMKRDMEPDTPVGCGGGDHSSDDDGSSTMDVKPQIGNHGGNGQGERGRGKGPQGGGSASDAASKKTKGRVKIKMEFIDNKLRRYTTFSKRKTGIMKKAYELSTLTGTQVMLLVASETGHVYTFATRKLQPMITSDAGKALIQTCLNSPDPAPGQSANNININNGDQRMSATGFEETELTYNVAEDEQQKVRQMMYANAAAASAQYPVGAPMFSPPVSMGYGPPVSPGGGYGHAASPPSPGQPGNASPYGQSSSR